MRRSIFVFATLAALGGCTPYTAEWSPAQSPKRNTVTWVETQHAVPFADGSAVLSAADRGALERFLARQTRGENVRVTVAAADGGGALAVRRETAVVEYLRGRGLDARLGPLAGQGGSRSTVTVAVGRFVVTPPACPDWSKSSAGDSGNTTGSNFGCATATNLGMMVADPGHLVRGVPIGPGDGEMLAKGVQDYRTGKADRGSAAAMPPPGGTLSGAGQ
jgi:pilus assembly protein CpaD